jgi:hypothetical protein
MLSIAVTEVPIGVKDVALADIRHEYTTSGFPIGKASYENILSIKEQAS